MENGAFKRRSKQDGASISISPRLQRSTSFCTTLPTIPAYEATHIIPDSLSASTSLIPHKVDVSSPERSKETENTDNIDPIELNPDVSVWRQDLDANSDPSSRPSTDNFNQPSLTDQLSAITFSNFTDSNEIVSNSSKTSTDTNSTTTVSSSPPRTQEPELSASDQIASTNPSYASAVPPSPASASTASQQEQIDQADKAFGSTFSFRLRQLSGEGKSGKQRVYEYFYTELHLINSLFNISTALMSISLDNIQKLKEVRGMCNELC